MLTPSRRVRSRACSDEAPGDAIGDFCPPGEGHPRQLLPGSAGLRALPGSDRWPEDTKHLAGTKGPEDRKQVCSARWGAEARGEALGGAAFSPSATPGVPQTAPGG